MASPDAAGPSSFRTGNQLLLFDRFAQLHKMRAELFDLRGVEREAGGRRRPRRAYGRLSRRRRAWLQDRFDGVDVHERTVVAHDFRGLRRRRALLGRWAAGWRSRCDDG